MSHAGLWAGKGKRKGASVFPQSPDRREQPTCEERGRGEAVFLPVECCLLGKCGKCGECGECAHEMRVCRMFFVQANVPPK